MPTSQPPPQFPPAEEPRRHLNEEDRIRRIGELISKGILCSPALRDEYARGMSLPEKLNTVGEQKSPEQRIVRYLVRANEASPAELCATLRLSRSTAYRALQRLLSEQRVVTDGRTSAVAYRLADPSRN
jgi:hypothetical protein